MLRPMKREEDARVSPGRPRKSVFQPIGAVLGRAVQPTLDETIADVESSMDERIANVQAGLDVRIAALQSDLDERLAAMQSGLDEWVAAMRMVLHEQAAVHAAAVDALDMRLASRLQSLGDELTAGSAARWTWLWRNSSPGWRSYAVRRRLRLRPSKPRSANTSSRCDELWCSRSTGRVRGWQCPIAWRSSSSAFDRRARMPTCTRCRNHLSRYPSPRTTGLGSSWTALCGRCSIRTTRTSRSSSWVMAARTTQRQGCAPSVTIESRMSTSRTTSSRRP